MSGLSRSWDKGGERNWPWCVIGCTRKAGMEPSTWCTRRLGGGVATSAESTIAVTLAKLGATTTSSRLSSDASAIIPQPDPCPSSSPQHHDHGPFPSLCDLCERLRGGRLVSGGRSETDEEEEGGRGRMTRRGRSVADRGHASPAGVVSAKDRRRPDDGPSSSGCVSSVVRWNSTRSARSLPATSHEQQTLTWTILFLFLVLVFSASADLQKPTSRERSSKEEGGESISVYIYIYFRFDRWIMDSTFSSLSKSMIHVRYGFPFSLVTQLHAYPSLESTIFTSLLFFSFLRDSWPIA